VLRIAELQDGTIEESCSNRCRPESIRDAVRVVLGAGQSPRNGHSPLNSLVSLNSSEKAADPPRLNSLVSLNSSRDETEIEWPADLAAEAFHGIAGEIVDAFTPETEADRAGLLLNILVTFGNAIGRSPHYRVLATRHGANLFAALVGETGEGGKGSSWDPIQWLLHRAIPEYMETQVVGGVASGEGLISFVRDRREKRVQIKDKKTKRMTMEFETVIEDEGVEDKRCLVLETEMSSLLKIMNRPGNVLSEQLRQAWDKGDLQNLNKNSPMRATGAHVSVLGHITPKALRQHLTDADAANGFANRFLWMLVRRSQYLPEGGVLPSLNNYVSSIRELVELASDKIMAERSEATKRMWAAVYPELRCSIPGMFGELIARRAPIVARLSLVYALLDGFGTILPEHLLAALAVWERSEASVQVLFGQQTGDPMADALYDAALARPEGASRTDLHAALGRNRPVAELDRALSELRRAGRIEMQRQKGEGGREVEIWVARPIPKTIGPARQYLEKAKLAYEYNENDENREGYNANV